MKKLIAATIAALVLVVPAVATASPSLSSAAASSKALAWAKKDARAHARDYYASKTYTSSSHTQCNKTGARVARCAVAWSALTTNDTTSRSTGQVTSSPIWYGCSVVVTVRRTRAGVTTRGGDYYECTKPPVYTEDVEPAVKPQL